MSANKAISLGRFASLRAGELRRYASTELLMAPTIHREQGFRFFILLTGGTAETCSRYPRGK